jgi:hypothetical protein
MEECFLDMMFERVGEGGSIEVRVGSNQRGKGNSI